MAARPIPSISSNGSPAISSHNGTGAFACNADYDKLHEELAAERDEAKRTGIAIEMQKLMDASLGYIWVNHQVACAVTAANVEAAFDPNGNPYLQYFKKV
jgi:peptide/nickel transport system substrate-binding protein